MDERILHRRKALVTGLVLLTCLVLLGFIFGSWNFLQKMGNFLEQELALRLRSVASLTAEVVESGNFTNFIENQQLSLVLPSLTSVLSGVDKENQLQGVYLVDDSYRVIASSRDIFSPGERLTFLAEDSLAFSRAVLGIPAVSPTHVIENNRFKSAYAPVVGSLDDVVAVIVVQASADFFDLLRAFKRGLILTGIIGFSVTVLFSLFLFWAISLLIKTHESLRKTERLAAMGQMAATVAHEIRNPLGIIKSTADVLQSKYANEGQPDELFEFIPSEVRRLNRLITDFLTFARDRDLEVNASDIRSTVEKSLTSLEDEIHQAKVQLEKDFEPMPSVNHDEDAINQVLLNLTFNAIHAMNGGGNLSVRLKKEMRKGRPYARIEIADNGCGIEGDPEKIFEPFYTTKTSGSGLGLAICKRLIEKHGGWIEVHSGKGKGTTMRFYLPAEQ
ncbi:MAG: nitrogen regulation protein NR(II) [bacterium]